MIDGNWIALQGLNPDELNGLSDVPLWFAAAHQRDCISQRESQSDGHKLAIPNCEKSR
jgi:hypothetical protein